MTCDQARQLLDAYLDGELADVVRISELEEHFAECPACAKEMAARRAASSAIRQKARYFDAPAGLEAKISDQTGVEAIRQLVKPDHKVKVWDFRIMVGPLIAAALLTVAFFMLSATAKGRYESNLVASHYRSLQANHLFDVASTDQHTVKPWFQGKLDFSPNVPDLTAQGFPLLGGRLDYMNHGPAAAIVYRRAKHVINVFVTRKSPLGPDGVDTREGYNMIKWTTGDLDYWAVSDVNPTDLEEFAKAFQLSTGPSR